MSIERFMPKCVRNFDVKFDNNNTILPYFLPILSNDISNCYNLNNILKNEPLSFYYSVHLQTLMWNNKGNIKGQKCRRPDKEF